MCRCVPLSSVSCPKKMEDNVLILIIYSLVKVDDRWSSVDYSTSGVGMGMRMGDGVVWYTYL